MEKILIITAFEEVNLVSLTLEYAFFCKIFPKTQVFSLSWFVAEHYTSTVTGKTFPLFYLKFSAKFNELILTF